ncbi:MAG TPA: SH3 domain-containing protein [Tepidiformaceae bacterium]|nr:SH3 domain-containing protein [Tepidiformaceae bacterium]
MRLMTSCRTILAGLALVLLALVAVGSRPAHALDPNDPNDRIALTALKYEGSWGGQCWQFVKDVVREATGREIGFDYREGFFQAGAIEVTDLAQVRSGDIIQIADDAWTSPDADYAGLHTSIVLTNLGDGSFDVIDSNQNWDEMVGLRPNYHPFDAAARYGLDVHFYRITGGEPGPAAAPGAAHPVGDEWRAGDTGVVNTPGDCLNLRTGGGLGNSVVACLSDRTRVTALAESVVVGGRYWAKVRTDAGAEGWVATEYLTRDVVPATGAGAGPILQFRSFVPAIAFN